MSRLEAVVAHGARGRKPNVDKRSPALQLVMTIVVEEIRSGDGNSRPSGLNRGERWVIVHDVIGEKNLLSPAPPHIQRRKIIQRARRSHACEQTPVFLVPETVLLRNIFCFNEECFGNVFRGLRNVLFRFFLRTRCLHLKAGNNEHQTAQSGFEQVHLSSVRSRIISPTTLISLV